METKQTTEQATASRGWISVDDRLPEFNPRKGSMGVQVLIWPRHPNSDLGVMFYGRRQTDEPNFYMHGEVLHGVTHWMPLPAAPNDAEGSDDKSATSTKTTDAPPLTTRQKVALAIAAAIHGALAREIFAGEDGKFSKQIADRSFEFADVFLAKGQA